MHEGREKDRTSGDLSARMAERRVRESFETKLKEKDDELKLANEKCQLLTRVTEDLISAFSYVGTPGSGGFSQFKEFPKRINLATTAEELAKISEELIKLRREVESWSD